MYCRRGELAVLLVLSLCSLAHAVTAQHACAVIQHLRDPLPRQSILWNRAPQLAGYAIQRDGNVSTDFQAEASAVSVAATVYTDSDTSDPSVFVTTIYTTLSTVTLSTIYLTSRPTDAVSTPSLAADSTFEMATSISSLVSPLTSVQSDPESSDELTVITLSTVTISTVTITPASVTEISSASTTETAMPSSAATMVSASSTGTAMPSTAATTVSSTQESSLTSQFSVPVTVTSTESTSLASSQIVSVSESLPGFSRASETTPSLETFSSYSPTSNNDESSATQVSTPTTSASQLTGSLSSSEFLSSSETDSTSGSPLTSTAKLSYTSMASSESNTVDSSSVSSTSAPSETSLASQSILSSSTLGTSSIFSSVGVTSSSETELSTSLSTFSVSYSSEMTATSGPSSQSSAIVTIRTTTVTPSTLSVSSASTLTSTTGLSTKSAQNSTHIATASPINTTSTSAGSLPTSSSISSLGSSGSATINATTSSASLNSASATPEIINTIGPNQIVHIGFQRDLSYQDIIRNNMAHDVFDNLDAAVVQALQINSSEVFVERVWGHQRPEWYGELQAIADVIVPQSRISELQTMVETSNSSFYTNQTSRSVQGYVKLVDPSLPLTGSLIHLNDLYDRKTSIKVILSTVLGTIGVSVLLGAASALLHAQSNYMRQSLAEKSDQIEKGNAQSTREAALDIGPDQSMATNEPSLQRARHPLRDVYIGSPTQQRGSMGW